MARIRTYPLVEQADITADDYLLGNDLNDGSVITKRFSLEDLKDFINDGTDQSLIDLVPKSYTLGINSAGSGVTPVPLLTSYRRGEDRTTFNSDTTDPNYTRDVTIDRAEDGLTAFLTTNNQASGSNGNGGYFIRFENYDQEFFWTSFVGATLEITTEDGVVYTATTRQPDAPGFGPAFGTLQSIWDSFSEYTDPSTSTHYTENGDFYNFLELETISVPVDGQGQNTAPQIVNPQIRSITVMPGNNSNIWYYVVEAIGDVDIKGNLTTGNRVDVGESGDNSAELHVHGTIFLAEDNDGIVFGDTADSESVQLRTDTAGDDLTITGGGFVDIRPDSGFRVNSNERSEFRTDILVDTVDATDHVLTVQDEAETLSAGTGNKTVITPTGVEVNGTDLATSIGDGFAPNQGAGTATLSTLTVAGTTYNIPSPTGSTAVFPGVDVDLANSPTAFNIATFFTGDIDIDPGTGVISITVGNEVTVPDLSTTVITTTADGNTASIDTSQESALNTAFTGGNLFFTEAAYTSVGTVLTDSDNVYQVTNVNATELEITYSLIPGTSFRVATNRTEIRSNIFLPGTPERGAGNNRVLFIDANNSNAVSYGDLEVSGNFQAATYEVADGGATGTIESIDFIGDHNIDTSTNGANNPIIDITGRYRSNPLQTGNFTAEEWNLYVLDTVAVTDPATTPTVTLPQSPVAGDSIKFSNLSVIGAGNTMVDSSVWSIAAGTNTGNAQYIMKQTTPLQLDDPTAGFELYYTGTTAGWIIIGIN